MKMYRCSLTGFFSITNNTMVYDKDKTVFVHVKAPDELTGASLGAYLMGEIFTPTEPVGDIPLNIYRVGDYSDHDSDSGQSRVYTFYKKDDPLIASHLEIGATAIQANGPMTFKITKLTDEEKQADGFSNVPYLDVYDVLIDFINTTSSELESLGYEIAKTSEADKQIVFHSLGGISKSVLYPSVTTTNDDESSISCERADEYFFFDSMENYDQTVNASGSLKIIDTVTKESKTYSFNNFYDFFNSQVVSNTLAFNHQSMTAQPTSAHTYCMYLYGPNTPTGEAVHDIKVRITMNNPEFKLKGLYSPSITGDGTKVLSACLKNPVY